jgi:predicted lipid carrier protein YhbT
MAASDEARLPALVQWLVPPFAGLPLGPLLTRSLRSLARRRPAVFDRLGDHRAARFLIDPVDLPFAFLMIPDGESAVVRVVSKDETLPSDVTIRGPILMLLGLLDGTFDGDALFFHRTVSVSGQTEAIVALRNAIEDAELTPADLLDLSGEAGRIADRSILGGLSLARRILSSAATHPRQQP